MAFLLLFSLGLSSKRGFYCASLAYKKHPRKSEKPDSPEFLTGNHFEFHLSYDAPENIIFVYPVK